MLLKAMIGKRLYLTAADTELSNSALSITGLRALALLLP
jgi:hypothetical protein